jgi:methionine sulfoxide reductase heme-binding subunit
MSAIDLSSDAGIVAMMLLTLNILMGLLVSTNYNPARQWPRRKLPAPLFRIHNWTGYTAMSVVCLHPLILLFAEPKIGRFRLGDVLWPLASPGQRLYNCLGAAAFYLFALVVVTSYFRPRLRYRPWKKLHYSAYLAAAVMYVHGTLIDQNLKNAAPDLLDGEKLLVEGCFVLVVAASIWR